MCALRQPAFLFAIASLAVLGCQSGADTNSLIPSMAPAKVPPPETGSYAVPNQYSGAAHSSIGTADAYAQASGSESEQPGEVQTASAIRMVSHESPSGSVPSIPREAIANRDSDPGQDEAEFSSATAGGSIRPRLQPTTGAALRPVDVDARSSDWSGEGNPQARSTSAPAVHPPSRHAGDPQDLTWRAPVQW